MLVNNQVSSERRPELSAARRTLLEKWLRGEVRRPANVPAIPRRSDPASAPLSYAQQRLWFFHQLEPESPLYNTVTAIRLRGRLNSSGLQQALSTIVRRHEVLRAHFVSEDGNPRQIIGELHEIVPLPIIDLGQCPASEREGEAERWVQAEASRPFDLTRDLMLRATLARLDPTDHLLVIAMHHIASDGWSLGVLFRELTGLYEAFAAGRAPSLPELPIQYPDYALWQRESLQGAAMENQLAYWRRQLTGAPEFLELPTDHPRPTVQTFRGRWQWRTLPKSLADALKALSQRQGATLFMTLLAAFQALLHRYTNQEDILVGSPVAGRGQIETENLIGFFINTLVLRTDLSGDPPFRELLLRVREVTLGAYSHQDLPFDKLVQELRPERTAGHTPLVQVLFVLQRMSAQGLKLPDVTVTPLPVDKVHTGTSKFDLTFQIEENDQGMTVAVEYNTDLFGAQTIRRLCGHYVTLLEAIVREPDQNISKLPMLSDAECHQLLVDWNNTAGADPRKDLCLHQLIEEQTGRTPDRVAVVFEHQSLTYGELNRRANQLAHHLRREGVGPDVLVALFVERSLELLVGIVGTLKAGGAYVPIDPSYPKERLAYILEDSKAPIVLTQKSLVDELPGFAGQSICLDADWAQFACESEENLVTQVKPEHLAYVLFTSGSTGRPKGVALEHRTAVTFVQWAKQVFTPQELAAVLFSTSVCFDLSVFEIFVALSAGSKIILAQNALHLPTLPGKDEVTLINTVPSAIAELLRMGAVPASVKTVNLAGEALSDTLVEQIYANTNCDKVYNLYGPTETTTYSTYTLVRRGCPVTIGRPITDTQCYILNAHRRPVPIGVMGELYLAGGGLARGYYGRPELTNERFVPNPFSEERGARMYRTGDLCRWLPDGNIQYLGRMDHQVKLRGFRIELGEIEAGIARHPAVREVAVIAREDAPGDKCLVAYLVAENPPADLVEQLRALVRATMPEFMVPARFVSLEALPRTHNGKLDRKALPAPDVEEESRCGVVVAPRTLTEEMVLGVFRDVLNRTDFGVFDNFFNLGGHSLMAARIMFQLRAASGRDLPLRVLFERPTVSALAEAIDALAWAASSRQPPAATGNRVEIAL